MAKKRDKGGYTAADWPEEGDVQEDWDGNKWCAVCRSCWCPHCESMLYGRWDYMRTQRAIRNATGARPEQNRGEYREVTSFAKQ